jgi:ABC-type sugar transport system permease subunit
MREKSLETVKVGFVKRTARSARSWFRSRFNIEDRKAHFFCYAMIFLPFLSFVVFWLSVNISSIMLGFQDAQGNFTLEHFQAIFKNFQTPDRHGLVITEMLGRSLIIWLLARIMFIPSILSTYILFKKVPGHFVFRTIFMIPGILAGIVWTLVMKNIVGVGGPILVIAEKLGIDIPLEIKMKGLLGSNATAFITLNIIDCLPAFFAFSFVFSGAFARIPEDLFEVGKLEGIGFIREFIIISLPMVWGTVVISITGWFANIFLADNGAFLFTNGQYNTSTMGYYMFILTKEISDLAGAETLYGYPSAIGFLITVITVPIVLITRHYLEKLFDDVAY